jgi:hypothetical protein
MKAPKTKAIDLGALQDDYNTRRKEYLADAKALEKAQIAFDESSKAYHASIDALKNGSRTVLG